MNVAYSKAYRAYRRKMETIFQPGNLHSERSGGETYTAIVGYTLRTRFYQGELEWAVHGSEHELLDEAGNLLYSWRNLDNDCEFCQLIPHANGKHYLIFRRDLYGYSVLELETMRDFHFLPSEAFPTSDEEKFRETFIWTGVHYDHNSSLLAVTGCYWACPVGVVTLDFSDPMAEHIWGNLYDLVEAGNDLYDDLEFVRFEADCLIVEGINNLTDMRDTLRVPFAELRKAL